MTLCESQKFPSGELYLLMVPLVENSEARSPEPRSLAELLGCVMKRYGIHPVQQESSTAAANGIEHTIGEMRQAEIRFMPDMKAI